MMWFLLAILIGGVRYLGRLQRFVGIRFFRKTIVPFYAYEGSRLGRSVTDITNQPASNPRNLSISVKTIKNNEREED